MPTHDGIASASASSAAASASTPATTAPARPAPFSMPAAATPATSAPKKKPTALIVGGLGYIGRFLALHIHTAGLAADVRLVDKQLPELAKLAPEFGDACARARCVQADASQEQALARVFDRADGAQFDYVFNCGGDTRYGQADAVYEARSHALSLALGREAARRRIGCFVECSTASVYSASSFSSSSGAAETSATKPTLRLARWKLRAERDLAALPGLRLVVLRLPHVYGAYVSGWLGTALCMARTFASLGKEMRWLGDAGARADTVHVRDVARALWTAAEWGARRMDAGNDVFNIVDHGCTTQGHLATLLSHTLSVRNVFPGALLTAFARLHLDGAVAAVNDELLDAWAALLATARIVSPGPIGPFVEKEMLKDAEMCLDGGKFERTTGFVYEVERMGQREVAEVVESYRRMGWWP